MINFDESQLPSLGNYDEDTLKEVMRHMVILDGTFREVDETKLRMAFRQIFLEWYEKEKQKRANDVARQERDEAERKAAQEKAVIAAADSRLKEYVAAGLLETQYNFDLLREFMRRNGMSYSASAVSIAVNTLEDQLHWSIWSKRHQTPEPPPAEEVLGRCKDGKRQLPLATTEADLKKASTSQIQDWMSRKRESEGSTYILGRNSHGVSF